MLKEEESGKIKIVFIKCSAGVKLFTFSEKKLKNEYEDYCTIPEVGGGI